MYLSVSDQQERLTVYDFDIQLSDIAQVLKGQINYHFCDLYEEMFDNLFVKKITNPDGETVTVYDDAVHFYLAESGITPELDPRHPSYESEMEKICESFELQIEKDFERQLSDIFAENNWDTIGETKDLDIWFTEN